MMCENFAGVLQQLSSACLECSFIFIRFTDGYLPVPALQIECGEPAGTVKGVQQVIDAGQWVHILNGGHIKLLDIDTEAQPAVFLPHHNHRGCPKTVGGANSTILQHFLYLFSLLEFCCW